MSGHVMLIFTVKKSLFNHCLESKTEVLTTQKSRSLLLFNSPFAAEPNKRTARTFSSCSKKAKTILKQTERLV